MPTSAPVKKTVGRKPAQPRKQANAGPKPKPGPVTTRKVDAPVTAAAVVNGEAYEAPPGEELQAYYPPVQQIEGKVPYKYTTRMITPEQARRILLDADSDPTFHQRSYTERDVRRWKMLIDMEQFVHFLPDSPMLFDDKGMLMNARTRLTAVSRGVEPVGFVVITHVPRWMFPFFDTGKKRTLNHVFEIAGRPAKGQTGPTMMLAMKYVEVLRGEREPIGWQNWGSKTFEHFKVLNFRTQHDEMLDLFKHGLAVSRAAKVNHNALMVWRYFQQIAWPDRECEVKLDDMWQQLRSGAISKPSSPILKFREWAKSDEGISNIRGKRELHLILLNKVFKMHVEHTSMQRLTWAHGNPINTPYHPDGPEVAVKNVLAYCDKLAAAG